MRKIYAAILFIAFIGGIALINSCKKQNDDIQASSIKQTKSLSPFVEDFETGTKASYSSANVTLSTGSWTLNNALIGTSSSDRKNGSQSARITSTGKLTMLFDKTTGAGTVTIYHALYGSDATATWELYMSVNQGSTWTKVGSTVTTSSTTLTAQTFTVNQAGNVRFELRKLTGTRINIDDISISDYSSSSTLTVSPTTLSVAAAASSTASFTITSTVSWTATSSQTWLTLSAASGSSNATITVTAAQNTTTSTRSATVTIAGTGVTSQTVTVTQAAASSTTTIKILFDATKAETAGNADWVVDADTYNLSWTSSGVTTSGSEANPQRIPTPAQSGITSSSTETYWKGALSAWAVDCAKKGYVIETLPYNGSITYGNTSNAQDLSNYNVFIIDEPNVKFTATEKTAIIQFVQNGGKLVMISDHTVSDRNSDGYDSPAIWNDLMTNNTVQTNPFGITFDLANISGTYSYVANLSSDPILHGSYGDVTQVKWSNGTTMTLSTTANSTVKGLVFSTSSLGTTGVLVACATFGSGKVFAIGDSSVPDDGTGDTGDTLYNGYTGDASGNHRVLLMNAILWLVN